MGQNLLILDDDAAVRDSLRFWLESEGFSVFTYASPNQLLDDGHLPAFSCLVVDYHLPNINGLETVARLRERYSPVPAVLMTGAPNAEIRKRAADMGIAVIEKPVQGSEVIEHIRAILKDNVHGNR